MNFKKIAKYSLAAALIFGSVGTIPGCKKDNETVEKTYQEEVYNLYVQYMSAKGDVPLTYEQWLVSLKGEKGEPGKDAIAPKVRINQDNNEWEVSIDNGITWTSTGVKSKGENGREVEFNKSDTHIQWRYKTESNDDAWKNLIAIEELKVNDSPSLLNGVQEPSNELGETGDYYMDTSTGKIYLKAEEWNLVGFINLPSVTVYGDVNDDGIVNTRDVGLLIQHINDSQDNPFTDKQKVLSDVNLDGNLNMIDVEIIKKYIVGGYGINVLPYKNYIMYGDINSDGIINARDVALLTQHITNPETQVFTDKQKEASDVNLDGQLNELDVEIIRKYIVGEDGISNLPYLGNVIIE